MICAIVLLYFMFNSKVSEKTEAYVYAIITWTLFMFGVTEILSVFHAITIGCLWAAWGLLDAILLLICLKGRMFKWKFVKISEIPKSIICIIVFVTGVFFLALKTVPYNWDSMTFQL